MRGYWYILIADDFGQESRLLFERGSLTKVIWIMLANIVGRDDGNSCSALTAKYYIGLPS
jgi:hypothetical protein